VIEHACGLRSAWARSVAGAGCAGEIGLRTLGRGRTMTTRMITKTCITFWTLAAVAAWAAPSQAWTSCNNETIKGAYASVANEWIGKTPPYTPLAAVRQTVFDGNGNFTSANYLSTAGTISAFTLDGTYSVNADCTMTSSGVAEPQNTSATFFGVIAADSNKIYQIRTDANTG
jgi:hypothetical protein